MAKQLMLVMCLDFVEMRAELDSRFPGVPFIHTTPIEGWDKRKRQWFKWLWRDFQQCLILQGFTTACVIAKESNTKLIKFCNLHGLQECFRNNGEVLLYKELSNG